MRNLLILVQLVAALILIAAILLQQKGTGLSSTFGGSFGDQIYRSKRGLEKILFIATLVFAGVFITSALLLLVIR